METASFGQPLERFDLRPDPLLDHVPDRVDNELLERFDEEVLEGDHIVYTGGSGARVREATLEELEEDQEVDDLAEPSLSHTSASDYRGSILRTAVRRGILDSDGSGRALTDEPVRVFLEPRFEPSVTLDVFPYVTREVRRELMDLRADEFLELYRTIIPSLEVLGVVVVEESPHIAMLTVDVPPERLETLLDLHDWHHASAFLEIEPEFAAFSGLEIELALENGHFFSNGYDGGAMTGTSAGPLDPIRVGIIDTEDFNGSHNGWNRSNGSGGWTSRIAGAWNCSTTPCTAYTPTDPGVAANGANPGITHPSHGTAVAWTMAGSIMDGQVPGYNNDLRRMGSGVGRDVDIYYYRSNGLSTSSGLTSPFPNIIAHAIDNELSVVNMSLRVHCNDCWNASANDPCWCDTATDCGGMNAALELAAANNVVVVKSAGNFGGDHAALECSLTYPAQRPETVAVAAVESSHATWDSYATSSTRASSSSGPVSLSALGSVGAWNWRGVDMAAPGCIGWSFHWDQPANFHTYNASSNRPDGRCGTSIAAPQVAAQVALQHQVHRARGGTTAGMHWRRLALFLLSGDATNVNGNGLSSTSFAYTYGAGRLRAWAPSYTPGPRLWRAVTRTLGNGQTVVMDIRNLQPMLPAYQSVSVVVVRPEPQFPTVARMRLRVYDVCPPGGGELLLRSSGFTADLRLRVELRGAEVANRCLQARVTALGNWGAQERTVDIAARAESTTPWF